MKEYKKSIYMEEDSSYIHIRVVELDKYARSAKNWPPLPIDDLKRAATSIEDFSIMWHNDAGSASHTEAPYKSIYFQSPRDNASFVCFSAKYDAPDFDAPESDFDVPALHILLISSELDIGMPLFVDEMTIRDEWFQYPAFLTIFPLTFLRSHFEENLRRISELAEHVEGIQASLMADTDDEQTLDLTDLTRKLHQYTLEHTRLERRWKFEMLLSAKIRDVLFRRLLDRLPEPQEVKQEPLDAQQDVSVQTKERVERLMGVAGHQNSLSSTCEHTLHIVLRQAEFSRTTLYNLIAQRDTRVNTELAKVSTQLAEAAIKDSAAMKTIAAVTLIFLPPTFLCSFFSMGFFDWKAKPVAAPWLWLYFATAVPLTTIVILAWILFTKTSRKAVMKVTGLNKG